MQCIESRLDSRCIAFRKWGIERNIDSNRNPVRIWTVVNWWLFFCSELRLNTISFSIYAGKVNNLAVAILIVSTHFISIFSLFHYIRMYFCPPFFPVFFSCGKVTLRQMVSVWAQILPGPFDFVPLILSECKTSHCGAMSMEIRTFHRRFLCLESKVRWNRSKFAFFLGKLN